MVKGKVLPVPSLSQGGRDSNGACEATGIQPLSQDPAGRGGKHGTEKRGYEKQPAVKAKAELRILEAHGNSGNFSDLLVAFQLMIQCHESKVFIRQDRKLKGGPNVQEGWFQGP